MLILKIIIVIAGWLAGIYIFGVAYDEIFYFGNYDEMNDDHNIDDDDDYEDIDSFLP